nr:MAG TPA: hypothetical protein [Caudoviricetes sp.]
MLTMSITEYLFLKNNSYMKSLIFDCLHSYVVYSPYERRCFYG